MNWKVGEKYRTRSGDTAVCIGIRLGGRPVFEIPNVCYYSTKPDGKSDEVCMGHDRSDQFDVLPPLHEELITFNVCGGKISIWHPVPWMTNVIFRHDGTRIHEIYCDGHTIIMKEKDQDAH